MKQKAIILLSGGMDSATALAIAAEREYELYCITFKYGQKAIKEVECAKKLAERYNVVEHKIVDISFLSDLVKDKSALVSGSELELPMDSEDDGIPVSYVPFRNTILISIAVAWAESIGARYIYIGANAVDYSGYPDCRPEYFDKLNHTIWMGTEHRDIDVITPLINMSKIEIINKGCSLYVPFELTWSCYKNGDKPCGRCDSCILRETAFFESNHTDPLLRG